jgi:hypothetical protein
MNKPEWKDAPEWANWLAMDGDGIWFWYEVEPILDEEYDPFWHCDGKERKAIDTTEGYENSLEARP